MMLIGRGSLVFAWTPGEPLSVLEVSNNVETLARAGVYERCLAQSLVRTWTRSGSVDTGRLKFLLRCADRKKLSALSDPLPAGDSFEIYRGVVAETDPNGIFWSLSAGVARLLALRRYDHHLRPWPAATLRQVYRTTVPAEAISLHIWYPERECIVDLPRTSVPELVEDGAEAIIAAWTREGLDEHFLKLQKLAQTSGYHRRDQQDFHRERRRTHELAAQLGIRLR